MVQSEEFQIRTPFQSQYAFHKSKGRPVARYYTYRASDGKRKNCIKYFSKDHPFESPESLAEYDLWVVQMERAANPLIGHPDVEYSIGEMCDSWLQYRASRYSDPKQNRSYDERVVQVLNDYLLIKANKFRSANLLALRDGMVTEAEETDNRSRHTINNFIKDVISIFGWGSTRDFVDKSVVDSLREIKPLRKLDAPKLRGKKVVFACPEEDVSAAIGEANPTIRTMLILQLETGMRPKELREMQIDDLHLEDGIWVYIPKSHKNRHREEEVGLSNQRKILLSQRAAEALFDYHNNIRPNPGGSHIFTAREARAFDKLARHWQRYTPEKLGVLKKITRVPGRRFGSRGKPDPTKTYSRGRASRVGEKWIGDDRPEDVFTYDDAARELGVTASTVEGWVKRKVAEMNIQKAFASEKSRGDGAFTKDQYCKAVQKLFKNNPHLTKFTSYQIRHLVATLIDEQFGREAAQAVLGHANIKTTAIYAKRNLLLARETLEARESQ